MKTPGSRQCLEALRQFIALAIPVEEWTHAKHLQVAHGFVLNQLVENSRRDVHQAEFESIFSNFSSVLFELNAKHGVPNSETRGYHHTVTRCWLSLVANVGSNGDRFQRFLDDSTQSGSGVLLGWYPPEVLFSVQARKQWVAPPGVHPFELRYALSTHVG